MYKSIKSRFHDAIVKLPYSEIMPDSTLERYHTASEVEEASPLRQDKLAG